jgi:hypothetical protein
MYFFIPLMNRAVAKIKKSDYRRFLVLVGLPVVIWPLFYNQYGVSYSHLVWFLYVYLVGGYLRMFPEDYKNWKIWGILAGVVATIAVSVGGSLLVIYARTQPQNNLFRFVLIRELKWDTGVFTGRNSSITMLILAILIFILFSKITLKMNPVINIFAKASLGVYLLQSMPQFGGRYLYGQLLKGRDYYSSIDLTLYGLKWMVLIYLAGTAIFWLLRPVNMLVDKVIIGSIEKTIDKRTSSIETTQN